MQNKKKSGRVKSRDRVRRVNRVRDRDRAGGERVILFEKHPLLPQYLLLSSTDSTQSP